MPAMTAGLGDYLKTAEALGRRRISLGSTSDLQPLDDVDLFVRYLLDTNIDFGDRQRSRGAASPGTFPRCGDENVFTSVIVSAEVAFGVQEARLRGTGPQGRKS